MLVTQTRTQKSKASPKAAGRGVAAAGRSNKAKSEVRPVPASAPVPASDPAVSVQQRQILIEQAAYFRAEKRGFAPGGELQDWIEAEAEVLQLTGGD